MKADFSKERGRGMQHNRLFLLFGLTFGLFLTIAFPVDANAGWWFVFSGIAFIAVAVATICVDTVVAKAFFAVPWSTAFLSVTVANAVSYVFGKVAGAALLREGQQATTLDIPLSGAALDGVQTAVVLIGILVVLGAVIETAVLGVLFRLRGAQQTHRLAYLAVFAVNAITSGATAYDAFVPERYDFVSPDEVRLLQQVYADEIAFMHEIAAGLPDVWADDEVTLVDDGFIYPRFDAWRREREASMAGLNFVSLEMIGYPLSYPHSRRATLVGPRKDLLYPRVSPWEEQGVRVERAAARHIYDVWVQPAVFGPTEPETTYSYRISIGKFEVIALFDVPQRSGD